MQSVTPSPKEEATRFFQADREPIIAYLKEHGIPDKVAREEVAKFIDYWTEPNPTGKKQRWEMERTFEVKRRFATWMRRVAHDRRGWNNPKESKGIVI